MDSSQEKPKVLILTTGGTIAGGYRDASKAGDSLVSGVEGLEDIADISVVEFSNIGSPNMTPDHRLRMARRIQGAFQDSSDLSGVVVTHGTDTMEETAYFLHLTISDPRPVIVTGAMRPPSAVGNDGPANLLDAVRAAATPESRGRSVMIALSDKLYRAPTANKNHTTMVDAFVAADGGPVGTVPLFDSVRYEHPDAPEPLRGKFSNTVDQDRLPKVPIVYSYGGADGYGVRTQAERADGLVVAGSGQGHYGDAQEEAIDSVATNGVKVAVSSRTMAGPVPVGEPEDGTIGAGWLNPQKARILMALSLAEGHDIKEIASLYRETR